MPTAKPTHTPLLLWLGYVFFVVYGSLVPLRFKDRTFDDAWAAFQNIPFLNLGVGSRADWISNGVLYVPVGFLTAYLLTQAFQRLPRFILYVPALAFAVALALGVEFTQLYFPQRTVSINDIMAECIGSFLGILLAARYAGWFKTLVESFLNDSKRLKTLALDAYAFVYIALALFPYDFLISWAELSAKIGSSYWGWLVAGTSHSFVMAGIQLAAETTLALPFGFLLARLISPQRATYTQAALAGLLLGMGIELVQFFMASGISQGLSVLTRVVGVCGGLALSQHSAAWQTTHIANLAKRLTPAIALVYALTLLQINGFITLHWGGLADAKARFDQINFTPFYYHYFTSEAKALFSLSVVALSYVPIAVLTWARGQSARVATAIALAVCTCIELGKLFLTGTHADPSNLLIASAVSWFTVRLLQQISPPVPEQAFSHDANSAKLNRVAAIEAIATPAPSVTTPLRSPPPWLWLCLISAGVWVVNFPAFPVLVAAVLAACAAVVWRKPVWVFAIIPAALPIFDLATWSGRFYLDEFDALLFVGLAVAYARVPAPKQARGPSDPLFRLLAWLVAASFVIAALRGMLPFQWPNANSFNTYYSPYNALRIVKGAVWAWLVFSLGKRFTQTGVDIRRPFAWGMTAGLTLTVAFIIWERLAFSELLNFYSNYRVTGPFSAIHVGGAFIECFLAVATPFLLGLMIEKRHWLIRLAAAPILLATTYALMVTFSRNGFSSFAVGVLIVFMAAWVNSKQVFRSAFVYASILGAMLMVAVPIYKGAFTQSRMATVSADLDVRVAHWQDAMAIRDPDWLTTVFGMGLGRYPETSYWRSTSTRRSGTYQLVNEAPANTFLRLGSGDPIYVEQIVNLHACQEYTLKLDVRPSVPNSHLAVPICQKLMLTSFACVNLSFDLGPEFGTWRSVEQRFTSKTLFGSPWANQRPIKLALYYSAPRTTIDIDNISLQTTQGASLLANGDFSAGLDRWFYSADGHLQWHIKGMFHAVLFDQGWMGLIAMALFFAVATARVTRSTWRGDILSASTLAALMSFFTVSLFDTLIDSPRFLMLLLLLCGMAATKTKLTVPLPSTLAAKSTSPPRLSRRGIGLAIALAIAGVAAVTYLQTRPAAPLPTLGKGQQSKSPPPLPGQGTQPAITASNVDEIIRTIHSAKAGQTVLIQPGTYRINQNIGTTAAGTEQQRITVRASQPGQVIIEFNAEEGFVVQHAYWVFENLSLRGVCKAHTYCEHAFHVVGKGSNLVVRNNHLQDFNAHLKINGLNGDWPDHGLLQHNTLTNTAERNTSNPTTPFDLVGANDWQVLDNLVSNFVNNGSHGISYGIFMKGASSGGRIERNLVICTPQNVSQRGERVGISFGGGTTGKPYCRDQRCDAEHTAGLAANNIVAHCNDSGIDVNQSTRIVIAHNTLINTAGILTRGTTASATLHGNLLDGQIQQRKGGQAKLVMNEISPLGDVFQDPNALNFAWRKVPDNIPSIPLVPADLYGVDRGSATPPGALSQVAR